MSCLAASGLIRSYSARVATIPRSYSASPHCCTAQLSSTVQNLLAFSSCTSPSSSRLQQLLPQLLCTVSSSIQNSLLLAYVRGFLEPFGPESRADASETFRNISRAPDHVRAPFLDPNIPDTQLGISSPASVDWPRFRTRHPCLDSAGSPLDSPAYRNPWKPPVSLPNVSGRAVRDTSS